MGVNDLSNRVTSVTNDFFEDAFIHAFGGEHGNASVACVVWTVFHVQLVHGWCPVAIIKVSVLPWISGIVK